MRLKRLEDYRVVVYPAEPLYLSLRPQDQQEHTMKAASRQLEGQIKRYCDGVGSTVATWTTVTYCSHCGHEEAGEPDCCEAAIEEREVKGE